MIRSQRHRWIDVVIGGLLAGVSLLIYNATLTPSLSYKSPDGNELATIPYVLGLAHSTGYPLYTWLGKLFTYLPIGDVAHRINLMSAVLGAAGVGILYWILLTLFGRPRTWRQRTAAGFTALTFAFSRTFWSQTGIAEVYTSNVLMLALTLFIMLAWARVDEQERAGPGDAWWRRLMPGWRSLVLLSLAALSLGLSLGTHMSNLGFVPAIGLFVLMVNWRIGVSPAGWLAGISGFSLGALQFLWLPIKAGALNDRLMSRNAPDTWRGFYSYTLGAFPQFKFAFGWSEVPDRIVLYLALLVQQFGVVGVLMGLWGMWVVLFRWPKRFFLLMGMYLVHVAFFTQYAVFDLDVFFIPSHFLFAIFIGCGPWQLLGWLAAGGRPAWRRLRVDGRVCHLVRIGLTALIICVLVRIIGREVRANWEHNDYSDDTAINDFYESAFQLLPPDSVLLGRAGVFGYDMFYYRLVYDLRPDVLMPLLSTPDPGTLELEHRPVFTTERQGIGRRGGPWAWPSDLLPADVWYVPVLLGPTPAVHGMGGSRAELVLWQVSESPPEILLPADQATPQERVEIALEGKTLIGYDLEAANGAAQAGRPVHLTLYWQIERMDNLWASVGLAGEALVNYEIGLGNLRRRVAESWMVDGGWVAVDDFWLVIPRTADPGVTALSMGEAPAIHPLAGPSFVDGEARLVPFAELVIEEAASILNWE